MDFDKWFDSYSKRPKEYWSLRDAWDAALEQLERAQPATLPPQRPLSPAEAKGVAAHRKTLFQPVAAQGTDETPLDTERIAEAIQAHYDDPDYPHGCDGGCPMENVLASHDAALKASVRKETLKEYDELAKVHAKMKNDIREIVGPFALAHTEKAAQ